MIKVQGLNKYYNRHKPNQLHVLRGINLELPDTGIVAIFGKSGCGKTTLLNCIGGLDSYSSGSITVEGVSIGKNQDYHKCAEMGYIFQNYNLNKSESCYDNVADSLRLVGMSEGEEMERLVDVALTAVGMEKYKSRLPDTLSGGQQQRIAIARALVKNPRIILADEPTGNLDEENTLMIMELLSSIAKDRLVILVTHEKNLVDYYCHQVVELRDGEIVDIRENRVGGYKARKKNAIYLGDKEKSCASARGVDVSYYGEKTDTPLGITVVNEGGKLYLRIEGGREVKIIDSSAETVLIEGTPEDEKLETKPSPQIPEIKIGRVGRLFGFLGSVKSGFAVNFKGQKRGKRMLVRTLSLFAAAMVLIVSVFGSSLKSVVEISDSYNHNVFYIRTDSVDIADKLAAATEENSGIVSTRLHRGYVEGDMSLNFGLGAFQSAATKGSGLGVNATVHSSKDAEDSRLLAGSREIEGNRVLVSRKLADMLIDSTTLSFLDDYDSLIGLRSEGGYLQLSGIEIAGVVEGGQSEIYVCPMTLANLVLGSSGFERISFASDLGLEVAEGETVLLDNYSKDENASLPAVGDTVTVLGRKLTVKRIVQSCYDYSEWLNINGIERVNLDMYVENVIYRDYPTLPDEGYDALEQKRNELNNLLYGEYMAYYYEFLDDFLRDYSIFRSYEIEPWLWKNQIYTDARYFYAPQLYVTERLYTKLGRYPSMNEIYEQGADISYEYENTLQSYRDRYMDKMYNDPSSSGMNGRYSFAVSDEDVQAMALRYGFTDEIARGESYGDDVSMSRYYTVLRSSDPDKTELWLSAAFGHLLEDEDGYNRFCISPRSIRDGLIQSKAYSIISGIVTLLVVLAFMSLCMYFIMRSSLMSRIKEIGIYRAIGVSKRNIIFRFLVESAVLASATVLVGFAISSGMIYLGFYISPMFETMMYYPVWMCGGTLVVLSLVTLICGVLPVCSLLSKTPSQILAKYDI